MSPDRDTAEFFCSAEQASSQPPHLEIGKTIIISNNHDEAQLINAGASLQRSPDVSPTSQPHIKHRESAIEKGIATKNRARWVRVMFWIMWPSVTFFLLLILTITTPTREIYADGAAAVGAAMGGLFAAAITAYALVGILCAMLENIACMFRKRKDPSVRLPISNLVIPCATIVLVVYGGKIGQMRIANAVKEKRNRIESMQDPNQQKNDAQDKQELEAARKFEKSVIDEKQKQLDSIKSGHEAEPEPFKERFEKIEQIANSSDQYSRLVMKIGVEGLKELSVLGQEYQKVGSEYSEPSKHDLQALHESRETLLRCKSLRQKMNKIMSNYRDFLEKAVPQQPETIPFEDFDQNSYTAARRGFIDGACRTITQSLLDHNKTEVEIWDLKIAQLDLLIEKFTSWEISPDGSMLFDNESDLNELNGLQEKIKKAGARSLDLSEKMLNEKRERLNRLNE
jgi:hypothetical protein